MSISCKSTRLSRFNLFVCFVKIAFTWLRPASAMHAVRNARKNGSAAAQSLGDLVAVVILLQNLLRFLLVNNALALRSTCI